MRAPMGRWTKCFMLLLRGWGRWCPFIGSCWAGFVAGGPFILRHLHANDVLRVIARHNTPQALCGPAFSFQSSPLNADPKPLSNFAIRDTHGHPTPPNMLGGARWA